jgi:hypothetical protein
MAASMQGNAFFTWGNCKGGLDEEESVMNTEQTQAPLVFVSYSWDRPPHTDWVLGLATRLRSDGVNVILDRWDTRLGNDLSLFMELAGDTAYRILAIVTSGYVRKADAAEGGVGYERKMITPSLMKDLHGHRVVPVLRDNPQGELPRFLGAAKYVDLRDGLYEDGYYALLQDLHGLQPTPKPPLGKNPFLLLAEEEVPIALRHDPARYVAPALEGEVSFDYTNNDGRFVIGTGERSFTLAFSPAGHRAVYIYHDPPDIKTIALAPGIKNPGEVNDASSYDGSSRVRTIQVGDAAIIRNQNNYWAAVFVDEVLTRESSHTREPKIVFRYFIPAVPAPAFVTPTSESSVEPLFGQ